MAAWVVGGRFEDSAPLPNEAEIGAELGVSRTVVREAMRTLAAQGLISVRPRTGTRVEPRERWHLFDPQVILWRLEAGVVRDLIDVLLAFRLAIAQLGTAPCRERG